MASVAPSDVPRRLGQYTLLSPLSPTSGLEWRARNEEDGTSVCVKIERAGRGGIIEREKEVHALLSGEESFPSLIDADTASGFDFLVTDLPGPRFDTLHDNKPMDIGLVCSFAIQVLLLLETLHSKNLVHGNVSLQSTFLGLGPDKYRIFLTGFFVTRLIFERVSVPKVIECNPTFSSQRVHCLRQMPTPIDDLESLALILIHLIHPRGLPWSHLSSSPSSAHDSTLLSSKYRTSPDRLCSTIPLEFQSFLEYTRSFNLNPNPNDDASIDYDRWIDAFRNLKKRRRYPDHDMFVYEPPAPLSLPQIVPSNANTSHIHVPPREVQRRAAETASTYTPRVSVSTSRAIPPPHRQSHTASVLRPNFAAPPSTSTHRTSARPSIPSSYNEDFASIPPSTTRNNNNNNTNNDDDEDMVSLPRAQLAYLMESLLRQDAVPPSYAVSTSNNTPTTRGAPRSSMGVPTEPIYAEPAFRTMRHAGSSRSSTTSRPIRLPPRDEKSSRQLNSIEDTSSSSSSSDNEDEDEDACSFPELANTLSLSLSQSLKKDLLHRVYVQISSTTSKQTLAAAFTAFTQILRVSSYMSKPAFGVLAALQRKLYKREITLDYSGAKLVVVRELSYDIRTARTHKDVAKMLARFYAIMEANDHKVTKDGYTFLEGVTAKLKSL